MSYVLLEVLVVKVRYNLGTDGKWQIGHLPVNFFLKFNADFFLYMIHSLCSLVNYMQFYMRD